MLIQRFTLGLLLTSSLLLASIPVAHAADDKLVHLYSARKEGSD